MPVKNEVYITISNKLVNKFALAKKKSIIIY